MKICRNQGLDADWCFRHLCARTLHSVSPPHQDSLGFFFFFAGQSALSVLFARVEKVGNEVGRREKTAGVQRSPSSQSWSESVSQLRIWLVVWVFFFFFDAAPSSWVRGFDQTLRLYVTVYITACGVSRFASSWFRAGAVQ